MWRVPLLLCMLLRTQVSFCLLDATLWELRLGELAQMMALWLLLGAINYPLSLTQESPVFY